MIESLWRVSLQVLAQILMNAWNQIGVFFGLVPRLQQITLNGVLGVRGANTTLLSARAKLKNINTWPFS